MAEHDYLGELDPDDPTKSSTQIANRLRAAILARKLGPGESLPSQTELAERYGVARETVKRGLEVLRSERLIVTQQGGRTRVRAKTQSAVELRPHLEAAFEASHVAIDFAGFSSETLRGMVSEPLDMIRTGRFTPESIAVRVLITDMSIPVGWPALAETGKDDPRVRARMAKITDRAVSGLVDQVTELADLGLVPTARIDVRIHSGPAMFKMYLINRTEIFFGFYPIVEHEVSIDGQRTEIYDLMGKDVPLFHYAITDDESSHAAQFVESGQQWFDTMWDTVSREYEA